MLTKDVRYLSVLERFAYWINERESIRLQKEVLKIPAPWTQDEILQKYRFCNVVRMDDKVSRWLTENWYKPNYGHHNMLVACAIARFFNKPESLELITKYVFPSRSFLPSHSRRIKEILCKKKEQGKPVFNGAYMVRGALPGNPGQTKISTVMDVFVNSLVGNKIPCTDSMEGVYNTIRSCIGYGSFMAGQVVADLRHAYPGTWEDRNDWAPAGPGSLRGMSRVLKKKEHEKNFLSSLKVLKATVAPQISGTDLQRMELHDWQNCCCEFDKYERVLWEEGRPKQLYRGGVA